MIRSGVTSVGDCTSSGAPMKSLAACGLRGVVYQEAFGPTPDMAREALALLTERLDAHASLASDRLRAGVSPHSPYLACPEMLEGMASLAAAGDFPISIHLAESAEEDAFVRDGTGAIALHQRGRGFTVTPRGCSPVEHLATLGWLALPVPLQLVHLAQAGASDLAKLARASAAGVPVHAVACPRSNANLGNGAPDLAGWTRAGVAWSLGTDGAPAVGACDPFSEMRFAQLVSRAVSRDAAALTAREVVERATLGAAAALGLAGSVGSLEPGKLADLCAVRLRAPGSASARDPCSALVSEAKAADVMLTMVAGRTLWDGETLSTIDEPRALAACADRLAMLRHLQERRGR